MHVTMVTIIIAFCCEMPLKNESSMLFKIIRIIIHNILMEIRLLSYGLVQIKDLIGKINSAIVLPKSPIIHIDIIILINSAHLIAELRY